MNCLIANPQSEAQRAIANWIHEGKDFGILVDTVVRYNLGIDEDCNKFIKDLRGKNAILRTSSG